MSEQRIIFRPHRGSLKDAMQEARVFQSVEEMKAHVADRWKDANNMPMFEPDDVVISGEAMPDPRNGWEDTRYVCVKRIGEKVLDYPFCVGMCATIFP